MHAFVAVKHFLVEHKCAVGVVFLTPVFVGAGVGYQFHAVGEPFVLDIFALLGVGGEDGSGSAGHRLLVAYHLPCAHAIFGFDEIRVHTTIGGEHHGKAALAGPKGDAGVEIVIAAVHMDNLWHQGIEEFQVSLLEGEKVDGEAFAIVRIACADAMDVIFPSCYF